MSKMVSELGLGPFRSVITQPSRRLEDGPPPGPAKCLWVLILIFTKQFHAQKVLSIGDMLQVTQDPC
jgi:hypothetical protein